eukprot:847260-Ditylum_brightwellii.AAC.1
MAGIANINTALQLCSDSDITEMAKRLAETPAANGHVLLGTVVIKCMQTLVYWVKDKHRRGQPMVGADFNAAAIVTASADIAVQK